MVIIHKHINMLNKTKDGVLYEEMLIYYANMHYAICMHAWNHAYSIMHACIHYPCLMIFGISSSCLVYCTVRKLFNIANIKRLTPKNWPWHKCCFRMKKMTGSKPKGPTFPNFPTFHQVSVSFREKKIIFSFFSYWLHGTFISGLIPKMLYKTKNSINCIIVKSATHKVLSCCTLREFLVSDTGETGSGNRNDFSPLRWHRLKSLLILLRTIKFNLFNNVFSYT